jgi:hypothetical protein
MLRFLREKYHRYKTNTITGSGTGGEHLFLMNGDGNGTLGYTYGANAEMMGTIGGNTFGGRAYELTVGGDSQSSKGLFNPYAKKIVQPASTSIFDQIEDNLHPYKHKHRN